MIRSFGQDARSNAVNDRARVPMICLCRHLPRSEGARLERNRCHSCRHGHAKQIVTLRCGGALSSRVLSYLSQNTIEYYGQSSTRHLQTVRFFFDAAIPRCDCGYCAVMQLQLQLQVVPSTKS